MRYLLGLPVLSVVCLLPAWALTAEQEAKLLASDGAAGDRFGLRVALDGDTAIISADRDDDNGTGSGSAYVFARVNGVWTEQAKLLPADGGSGDGFGWSVALDGDTAVIGNRDHPDYSCDCCNHAPAAQPGCPDCPDCEVQVCSVDPFCCIVEWDSICDSLAVELCTCCPGQDPGVCFDGEAAYVFTCSGGVWTEQAKLLASDGNGDVFFGWSVAVDGDTAIIGAQMGRGAAYVFTRTGAVWDEQARLLASDGVVGDGFGNSVALDGDTAVISAYHDDNDNGERSGATYVFTRAGSVWTEQAKLVASDLVEMFVFFKGVRHEIPTCPCRSGRRVRVARLGAYGGGGGETPGLRRRTRGRLRR
jgi:hypothetical protein